MGMCVKTYKQNDKQKYFLINFLPFVYELFTEF